MLGSNFSKCVENEQFKGVTLVHHKALKRCLLAFYAVLFRKSDAKLHIRSFTWKITPINLHSNHLTKEDLKHLGYNVGKFLRLRGEIIARFVKHVFEEPFGTTHIRTIVAKLADRNPGKDRIPLLSADAMDQLFAHYKRYGNINLNIIKENKKK